MSRGNRNNRGSGRSGTMMHFEEHISVEEAESLAREGGLLIGKLKIIATRRKSGFVVCPDLEMDIYIDDDQAKNRAFFGDVVAVKLAPIEDWNPNQSIVPAAESAETSESPDKDDMEVQQALWNPRVMDTSFAASTVGTTEADSSVSKTYHHLNEVAKARNLQPKGRVVCIMESAHKTSHVGALVPQTAIPPGQPFPESQSMVVFQPADPRYPHTVIPRMELPAAFRDDPNTMMKHVYVADMRTDWPATSKMPFGHNVRSVGEMGSIYAETESLLIQNELNHDMFSTECLESLADVLGRDFDFSTNTAPGGRTWSIPEDEIARRRDLRSYRIFTIDPPTAKDLDDALHVTALDDGTFEIGVHIADVSYFLKEGTPLDAEARRRATSVYLVQKVIPMLPPVLCEQLCSLNPNVDRLAFSCIWRMNADGTLCESSPPWFGRTVIRSCAKLDYPTAQRIIDGLVPTVPSPGGDPDAFLANISEEVWERNRRPVGHAAWACAKDVIHMHSIAMNRRKSRLTNGAIVLSKFKLTYRLDEKGNPYTVGTYTIRESNQLVEEYMLLANYLVAEELLLKVKGAAFLRNHAPPNTKGMNEVEALANFLQIPMDLSSSKAIQESLARVTQEQTEEITSSAMTSLLMHPMNLAKYMVAQTSTPMGWKHFALAIPYYTHFTSPIRRYADVIVHRLLQEGLTDVSAAANVMESQSFMNYLKDTAEICNDMRVKAKTAQERSDVVFLAAYLMNRGAVYTEAIVIGMGEKSFTLLIPEYSMEARMFIDNMPSVAASYEPQSRTMTLRRSGNRAEHNGGNKEGRGEDKGGRGHDKRNNKNFNDRRNNANALDAHAEFDVLPLTILSKVTVRLSAKETPPVGVFVGLVRSSDGTYPTTSAGSKGHQSAGGGGMRGLEEDLESLKVSAFDGDDQL